MKKKITCKQIWELSNKFFKRSNNILLFVQTYKCVCEYGQLVWYLDMAEAVRFHKEIIIPLS